MMMKLFVWRNVLCDYTCGIAVALATNVEEARSVILRDMSTKEQRYHWYQEELENEIAKPPDKVVNRPFGIHCRGGGQ